MRPAPQIAPSNAGDTRPIVLIGFQSIGNLGLGYLAAMLRAAGCDVRVLDIELPQEIPVAAVLGANPILVGFSLIFQFCIRRYADPAIPLWPTRSSTAFFTTAAASNYPARTFVRSARRPSTLVQNNKPKHCKNRPTRTPTT
jgi:hypothetical protein